jgi:hypothetical protein
MPNIFDLVALTGQRDYRTVTSTTRQTVTDAVRDSLLAGGWTQLSSHVDTFGTGYTMRSQRVPWYEVGNEPTWYVGNKLRLRLDNNNSSVILITPSMDLNGVSELASSISYSLAFASVTTLHILSNPFQLVYWDNTNKTASTATQNTSLIVSAVNLPRFVQEKEGVIHCAIASNRIRGSSFLSSETSAGFEWSAYKTYFGTSTTWAGQTQTARRFQFLALVGGHAPNDNDSGKYIWSRSLDPTMVDETKWQPFLQPPYTIWPLQGFNVGPPTINGWLWDCIIVGRNYDAATVISSLQLREWRCFSHRPTQINNAASLFFCTTIVP